MIYNDFRPQNILKFLIMHPNDLLMNKLQIGALNCYGLKDKIDYPEFLNLVSKNDIFGVSETWLGDNDEEVVLPGYKFYPMNRKKERGVQRGSIGLFIKNNIKKIVKVRYDLSNENFLWCKLCKNYFGYTDDVFICVVYIPPEYSTRERRLGMDHFKCLIKDTTAKIKSNNIILMGDFNSRTGNLEDLLIKDKHDECPCDGFFSDIKLRRNNQDMTINKYGKKLVEFCAATKSYIANGRTVGDLAGRLTCYQEMGASAVDYAIINEKMHEHVLYFEVLDPYVGSDHCPLGLTLSLPHKIGVGGGKTTKLASQYRWNDKTRERLGARLSSGDVDAQINKIDIMLQDENGDITDVVHELVDIIDFDKKHKIRGHKKQNRKPVNNKKWYDHSCYEMSKRLKLVSSLCAKSPKDPFLRGSFKKTCKEYKKLIKYKKKEWTASMIHSLENLECRDPKKYWDLINEIRQKKSGEQHYDTDEFVAFFETLFAEKVSPDEKIDQKLAKNLTEVSQTGEPMFTMAELRKAIKLLKLNKSAGLDRIPAEFLKALPERILLIILKIINKIRTCFQYPDQWARGITTLLLKDGDDGDPNNYRAITVADAISKVFAIMLNERVEKWSIDNKIICKEQIGFEKKSRPADHLLVLKTLIDIYNKKGKKLYTCFVDYQKAFDSVWRAGLFYKLLKYGMSRDIVNIIKNMYAKTSTCLKMGDEITPQFRTYCGVRQGCILSPKLFNLFINDIPGIFDDSCCPVALGRVSVSCLMYADDLVIFSESAGGLQNCLNKLHRYTKKWGLKLNLKKTKVLIFRGGGRRPSDTFYFGHQQVHIQKNYKYLGTTISDTGSFKTNQAVLKKKGLRASYVVMKDIGIHAKPSVAISIFEKVVEPILTYNCEISQAYFPKKWNFDKFKNNLLNINRELNRVVLGFLRQILGVHKKTTSLATMAETGKLPISFKIFMSTFKYWIRAFTCGSDLVCEAIRCNNLNSQDGGQSWMRIIHYLLKLTGMQNMRPTNNIKTNGGLIKSFKRRLKAVLLGEVQTGMINSPKLDFYNKFKKSLQFESYLDNVPRHLRIHVTRLRLSSHNLPVETLRYNKTKIRREDRLCKMCTLGEVGDEDHYLRRCNEMTDIRNSFIVGVRGVVGDFGRFGQDDIVSYCMIMHDDRIQTIYSAYVKDILNRYREIVEDTGHDPHKIIHTRCGRTVKRPEKLDL